MSSDTAFPEIDIVLPVEKSEDEAARRAAVARKLKVAVERVHELRLRKSSLDARQRQIKAQLRFAVGLDAPLPQEPPLLPGFPALTSPTRRVLIVGCGPAGLFAALRCIELGIQPIILERGKDASSRRFDLAPILRQGTVIEDSNYCFGEGGAGTFSDGKLYTRATKRGPVRKVYEVLVAHGAPSRILTDAHPHIGSNLLPKVVMAIRNAIRDAGGEVRFETKVTGLERASDGRLIGLQTQQGDSIRGDAVLLATGHSARDIYRLLAAEKILLEPKPFAVGVRIEHPQPFIDQLQYHLPQEKPRPDYLPAARYRVATKIRDRGVHSFCMCPGGFVVPAATENDEVVVNGMSLSRRDSPFANSGLVVTVEPEDTQEFADEHGILAGVAFQKSLERRASVLGGGRQKAPAQRVVDFLARRVSSDLPETSYFPGLTSAPLHEALPAFIVERMAEGLRQFDRTFPGFARETANLIGFETRTSSPLRIPRDEVTLQHPEVPGLFPCGEGAGYAGGIVSAALDGLRTAEALAASLNQSSS